MRLSRSFIPVLAAIPVCAGLCAPAAPARADEIRNPKAIFAGIDKITGRITTFDVAIDETVQFGTLQVTPRVCLTRPQTEAPLTEGFVQVDDVENGKMKRIFSGWMFAASPGLHGVEHPVFDVWLKDCVGGKEVTPSPANAAPQANRAPPPNAAPSPAEGAPAGRASRTIKPEEPVEPSMDSLPPSPADVDSPDIQNPEAQPPETVSPETQAPEFQSPPPAPEQQAPATGARGKRRPLPSNQLENPDNGLGPPVEVGPAPGMRPEGEPIAPPKPARRSKHKRQPPNPDAPIPPADIPTPAPQPAPQPSGPQNLLKNLPFMH
jgi:hypothetical protein